jgi:alanine racemase
MNELCAVADICFVSSTAESVEIKDRGFSGRVVLFSGSVVYMDEETVKKCDYVVHIPYMKADSDNLKTWITSPVVKLTKFTGDLSVARSSIRRARGGETVWHNVTYWLKVTGTYLHLIRAHDDKPVRRRRQKRSKINDSSALSSKVQSGNAYSSMQSVNPAMRLRYPGSALNGISSLADYVKKMVKRGIQSVGGFTAGEEPAHTYSLGTKFNFLKGRSFLIDRFQHDVERTFCMWRLMNPTGKLSYSLIVYSVSYLSILFFYTLLHSILFFDVLFYNVH